MLVGTEWIIDAEGCDADALRDPALLRRILDQVVAELGLHVVNAPAWHKFPGAGGITGLVMLSESHLACHTYPEYNMATFNLYCCRSRPEWPWQKNLAAALGARVVNVRQVPRGAAVTAREQAELPQRERAQ